MNLQDLPFWHFFQQLEKELSYERWIDKYRLFLDAIFLNEVVCYDNDWAAFRQFCKTLYLQNEADEIRFDQLLNEAIIREKDFFEIALRNTIRNTDNVQPVENEGIISNTHEKIKKKEDPIIKEDINDTNEISEPENSSNQQSMYYNPPEVEHEKDYKGLTKKQINFLLTDEYFPITRRQMIKGWQFLRHKEKSRSEEGIDLKATIQKIAKEGLFLEPEFGKGLRNRDDTVVIFADCRGSMAPFHELTNRLIQTARGEGGHPKVQVFYFQNFPVSYVYKGQNLDGPIKLKEALSKANKNLTLAIIISDAGAARGNTNTERNLARLKVTEIFLNELGNSCAHTIWLNPMPSHRWKNTAAALIKDKVFLMAPIFDHASYNFQDTFRTIIKQNLKNIKSSS